MCVTFCPMLVQDYLTEKFYNLLPYNVIPVVLTGADMSAEAPPTLTSTSGTSTPPSSSHTTCWPWTRTTVCSPRTSGGGTTTISRCCQSIRVHSELLPCFRSEVSPRHPPGATSVRSYTSKHGLRKHSTFQRLWTSGRTVKHRPFSYIESKKCCWI